MAPVMCSQKSCILLSNGGVNGCNRHWSGWQGSAIKQGAPWSNVLHEQTSHGNGTAHCTPVKTTGVLHNFGPLEGSGTPIARLCKSQEEGLDAVTGIW